MLFNEIDKTPPSNQTPDKNINFYLSLQNDRFWNGSISKAWFYPS